MPANCQGKLVRPATGPASGNHDHRKVRLEDGISAAAALLIAHSSQPPDTVADQVTSGMTPPAGFEDDVAVLIYRHPPGPLDMRVAADDPSCLASVRARLRQWLPAAGIGADQGADILSAIGEATANAYEHGTTGRGDGHEPVQITVTVRLARATVQATIADTGTWRTSAQEPGTRGHGIAFMHALMDKVTISTTGHGTTVTMTKEL